MLQKKRPATQATKPTCYGHTPPGGGNYIIHRPPEKVQGGKYNVDKPNQKPGKL